MEIEANLYKSRIALERQHSYFIDLTLTKMLYERGHLINDKHTDDSGFLMIMNDERARLVESNCFE